ncbi:ATPase, V0 complex, subunit E1/e2 [Ephemerocybe angulata]|uniref:ATPase, V0 complex, subunit E1/e2 n=1 Tax=Ephemerocybe angulata TaxID=980116 RepID=A0A8H6M8N6_9AGAR|nr:ATPase, V0 complex, subunit E1/e2 [Tulosesus angulatus]KAF6759963.1 ATPase, V0 complex, subunit E1/e2 [Tulosesus angulatus]
MASLFPIFLVLAITLGLMSASFLFVRKGPNQAVIRTSLMLTFAVCYLTWMVTYLAQLHPLMVPTFSAPPGHAA